MALPDICRQHVQDIVNRAQSQHKEKITALHQRFKEYHTKKMTDLHTKASDKLKAAKSRIEGLKGVLATGSSTSERHSAAIHNELENVRDAWRNRENNPGNLTTSVGRLMRLHQSLTTGRDPEGKYSGPESTLDRFQKLQSSKIGKARTSMFRKLGIL